MIIVVVVMIAIGTATGKSILLQLCPRGDPTGTLTSPTGFLSRILRRVIVTNVTSNGQHVMIVVNETISIGIGQMDLSTSVTKATSLDTMAKTIGTLFLSTSCMSRSLIIIRYNLTTSMYC